MLLKNSGPRGPFQLETVSWHTATEGSEALSRAHAGGDYTNPALAGFVAVVWALVLTALWRRGRARR
jgi:hypothetical protein